ncbi:nickel/cobalt transporter [Tardiphaga robiniae]|uniref:Nickel/cobalt efflux system n=1 Tax=Tardiphaga robiniae TaxID=943830 RepID=A0A161RQM7_9BRAD|nr:nickel transporter [Tardiphaga robiniae]
MLQKMTIRRVLWACAVLAAVSLITDGALHDALAQNPFGAPKGLPDSQVGGIIGWLLTKQSEFYRAMSSTIRVAKSDGSAVWTLLAISFAYGIFHAAGPGHGKAVISSYLVANEETAKRGIILSFVSALMQALVAVLIVGIGAWLLNVTAKTMCSTERWVEIASYGLIAAFGARLVWSKGRGFIRALRPSLPAAGPQLVMAHASASAHAHDHGHDHHHHDHHGHAHAHAHAHTAHAEATASAHAHHDHSHHDHVHDEHCGHSHGPTPDQLAGPGGWARGLSAVFTVGIRPCSGAILVLVFALAQGMFWAGIAATFVMGLGTAITVATIAVIAVSAKGLAGRLAGGRDGSGALVMRGIEFGAAALVMLFGVGLLLGYVAAERVTCF